MTGNIFLDCVFLFLICYAIVCMFYQVSEFLLRRYCRYPQKAFLVLDIHHQSDTLDCDIRCALSKSIKYKCALVVVCNDLDLEEYGILYRITDNFNHIVITTPEEFSMKVEIAKSITASQ